MYNFGNNGNCCGGYNYTCCQGNSNSNRGYGCALILVLFILLVIIGASRL